MVDTASFGVWLRQRRKALDLTQEALAERVGCAVTTIRKLEGDVLRPSKHMAERLAERLNLTAEERVLFVREARSTALDQYPAAPARIAQQLPAGTVTFLFTDIQGSTRLWEEHGQSMPLALERHHVLLRYACEAYSGQIFKTVGDAVCVAFASAHDAFMAALAAQRSLYLERWQRIEPLQVRMALHSGEVEARDGDYYGLALSRIDRLLKVSHGGQIVLSRATQELVRDQLPNGVTLRDLGEHRLKDLSRPEQIFQVLTADLPADFPALAALDNHLTNLPTQPTPLLGREREVQAACALLQRADLRLLTLTGPGGIGKTRLGLQVAAELLELFPHGVYLVSLAPISDPALVASVIAQTLEIKETGGQPLLASFKAYLRAKQILLVLDNIEQLVAAGSVIADLLAAAPSLKILTTSRERLQITGEYEYVVPPLAVPDWSRPAPIERLTQYDAVRLFIARAEAVHNGFAVTNANAPAVAAIAHRLDGLPLAIELAAAQIKYMSAETLLRWLSSQLSILTGGARDLPARQQTLRNTIAWSYELLDSGEQTLFAQLGIFVGGCAIDAVAAICDPNPAAPLDIVAGLTALVNKSLLQQTETDAGEARFRMLATIREYALERLEQSGAAELVRKRYADWSLQLVEAAEPQLRGAAQADWLQRLEQEEDNLRAALELSQLPNHGTQMTVRLVAGLWRYWFVRGYLGECRRWLEIALAADGSSAAVRARALFGASVVARYQGDYPRAAALGEAGLALARELKDTWLLSAVMVILGTTYYEQGKGAQSSVLLEESVVLARAVGDTWLIAWALHTLGWRVKDQGDYQRAVVLLEESLVLARAVGDRWLIAWVLHTLGWAALYRSGYQQAAALLEESLVYRQELGDKPGIAWALASIGRVALAQGDYVAAQAMHERRLTIEQEMGNLSGIAGSFWSLGDVALAQADYVLALALHTEGLMLARELADKRFIARSLRSLGDVVLAQGNPQQAQALHAEGLAFAYELGDRAFIARSLRSIGDLALIQADYAQAAQRYMQALALLLALENRQDVPACVDGLAAVALAQGDPAHAVRLSAAALTLREMHGLPLPPAERDRYERIVGSARAQLDVANFASAWSEGRSQVRERGIAGLV